MDKFALTAQLLLQAPANTMQVMRGIRNSFKDVDVNVRVKTDIRALQGIENDLKRLRDAGKQTSQFYNEIGGILANATRRFAGISIATGTFLGLARAIKGGIGDAITFEREMTKIAQATDSSVHATRELAKEIGNIGKQYGVASDELVKFARNFAQAGFNAKETSAALDLLARTDVIGTFGTMENTMEGIITTQAVFNKQIKGSAASIAFLEATFDSINKVSKKYAIESEDIITAVRRTGAVFEAAGGSVNELISIMTSIRSTTRESADTIANGLKTIFTRLQRKDTLDSLKELGIELEDLDGKFIKPQQALEKIGMALSLLPKGSIFKNNILEEIGGIYQIGRLIPAIQNYALQQQILNEANTASGDINKDLEKSQGTLANKIMRTKESFTSLIREFALSDGFKKGVTIALAYAEAFIRLAESLKEVLPYLIAYASISIGKTAAGFAQSFIGGRVPRPKTSAGKALTGSQGTNYATGGFVSGVPGIDKNPAMLTDGEFVVNRKDAQRNKGLLAAINSGRKVRMLAGGSKKIPAGQKIASDKDFDEDPFGHTLLESSKVLRVIHGTISSIMSKANSFLPQTKAEKEASGIPVTPKLPKTPTPPVVATSTTPVTATTLKSNPAVPSITPALKPSKISAVMANTPEIMVKFQKRLEELVKAMGPEAKKLKSAFRNEEAKVYEPTAKELSPSARESLSHSGKHVASYSGTPKIIAVNPMKARLEDIDHEVGHAADRSGKKGVLDVGAFGPSLPSTHGGTVNNVIAKLATPANVEASKIAAQNATKDVQDKHVAYKSKPQEAYADMFMRANDEGKKLLINLSSSSKSQKDVDNALKKMATSILAGKASYDKITERNILAEAGSRGLLAQTNVNKPIQPPHPPTSSFVPLSGLISSVKPLENSQAAKAAKAAAEAAAEAKAKQAEQFSGMRSSSFKPPKPPRPPRSPRGASGPASGPASGSEDEEVAKSSGMLNLGLFGLVSVVTAATESISGLDESSKRAIQSSVAAGVLFYSMAQTILPTLAGGFVYAQSVLENTGKHISAWTNKLSSGLNKVAVSAQAAAASEDVETAANARSSAGGGGFLASLNLWIAAISVVVGVVQFISSTIRSAAENLKKESNDIIKDIAKDGGDSKSVSKAVDKSSKAFYLKDIADAWDKWNAIDNPDIEGSNLNARVVEATAKNEQISYNYDKKNEDVATRKLGPKEAYSELSSISSSIRKNAIRANALYDEIEKSQENFTGMFGGVREKTEKERNAYDTSKETRDKAVGMSKERGSVIANTAFEIAMDDARMSKDSSSVDQIMNSKEFLDMIKEARAFYADSLTGSPETKAKNLKLDDENMEKRKKEVSDGIKKQIEAQNNMNIAREAEIKLMIQLSSQFDNLAQSTLDLDNAKQSLDVLTGKSSGGVDPSRFSDISRVGNMKDFERDTNAVGKNLGPDGQKIANEIIATANVIKELGTNINLDELNRIGKANLKMKDGDGKAGRIAYLNEKAPNFQNMNKEGQEGAIAELKEMFSSGLVTYEKLESFKSKLASNIKPSTDLFGKSAGSAKEFTEQLKLSVSALLELESAVESLRGGLVDIQETGRQRFFEANSGRATSADLDNNINAKEASRSNSMRARLGAIGNNVSGPEDLGKLLNKLTVEYNANKKVLEDKSVDDNTRNNLSVANVKLEKSIKAVTGELTKLTDQSARAADVMSQLDRERGRKDFVKGKATDFVLGGAEERMSMQEQFKGLQHVMMSGSFQNLPEDLRKSVNSLVDEISKSDPNNQFVKGRDNAITNDFQRAFGRLPTELERSLRGGASNKEAELTARLIEINKQEIVAQNALIDVEKLNLEALRPNTVAIINLTNALNAMNGLPLVDLPAANVPPANVPPANVPPANIPLANAPKEKTPNQRILDKYEQVQANKGLVGAQAVEEANAPKEKTPNQRISDKYEQVQANKGLVGAQAVEETSQQAAAEARAIQEAKATAQVKAAAEERATAEANAAAQVKAAAEAAVKAAEQALIKAPVEAPVEAKVSADSSMVKYQKQLDDLVGSMGPEADKLKSSIKGMKVHAAGEVSLGEKSKESLTDSGNANGLYTRNKEIVVNPSKYDERTIEHEAGHAADRSGNPDMNPVTGSGPHLPSMISDSINNIIAKAGTDKVRADSQAKGETGDFAEYRVKPQEVYAEIFRNASLEGKRLLVNLSSSSTNAKEVNDALITMVQAIEEGRVSYDDITDSNILIQARNRDLLKKPPQGQSGTPVSSNSYDAKNSFGVNLVLAQGMGGGMGEDAPQRTPKQQMGDKIREKKEEASNKRRETNRKNTEKRKDVERVKAEAERVQTEQESQNVKKEFGPDIISERDSYIDEVHKKANAAKSEDERGTVLNEATASGKMKDFRKRYESTLTEEELKNQEDSPNRSTYMEGVFDKQDKANDEWHDIQVSRDPAKYDKTNLQIAKDRQEHETAMAAINTTQIPDRGPLEDKATGIPHEYKKHPRSGKDSDYNKDGTLKSIYTEKMPEAPPSYKKEGILDGVIDMGTSIRNGIGPALSKDFGSAFVPSKSREEQNLLAEGTPEDTIRSNWMINKSPEHVERDRDRSKTRELDEAKSREEGRARMDARKKGQKDYFNKHYESKRNYARGGTLGPDNMIGVQSGEGIVNKSAMSKIGKNGLQAVNNGTSIGSGGKTDLSSLNTFTNNLKTTLESAINRIPESMNTFSMSMGKITTSLDGIAQSLSNITMKHEVNIDGQINVAGFNVEKVAEALKDSLGDFISLKVVDAIGKQNKAFRTA